MKQLLVTLACGRITRHFTLAFAALAIVVCMVSTAFAQTSINSMTGALSYSYPITSTTVNTAPVDVHLAWLPNLEQVYYVQNSYRFGIDTPPLDVGHNLWTSGSRRHGGWAICVNGFVVQLFNYVQWFDSPAKGSTTEPQDSMRNWLTVGYDVCNRMQTLAELKEPDVIKLLQADGSVLELRNAIAHDAVADEEDRYVGWYYVNGLNTNAFAVVDYDDTYYPAWMQGITANRNTTYVSEWAVRPRVVRYYPGDGLEYVFREIILPYGQHGLSHVGVTPTVFYLEEINRDNVNILTFKRSKHYPSATDHDLTPGRGLVEEFHGHRISYENNFVTVEAEGHTHRLLMTDQFTVPNNDINGATSYLDDEANTTRWADYGSRTRSYYSNFMAYWVSGARMMIRAIVQPNGEVTKIAYEKYERIAPWAWWYGFRPNRITTRENISDIVYAKETYLPKEYDTWHIEESKHGVQASANNVVWAITLSTNHTTPKQLRRTTFEWYNPLANQDTGYSRTTIRLVDKTMTTADSVRNTTVNYWSWRTIPASIDAALDDQVHRYLRNSFSVSGDVQTALKRKEEQLVGGANMFFYPTESTTWVRDGLANADLQTEHNTYGYTFADYHNMTHGTYGAPPTAMKNAYGKGVATTTNVIYEPMSTTNVFRTIETSLATNLLYGTATCSYVDTTFMEAMTRRALDSVRNGSSAVSNFQPSTVIAPSATNHTYRLCPIWGMESSVSVKDWIGNFIGGMDVSYQASAVCSVLVEAFRGMPEAVTSYGMAGPSGLKTSAPFRTQTLFYTNGSRAHLPRLLMDTHGARVTLSYASGTAPNGIRTDNAGTVTTGIAINDFDYLHDDAIAVVPTVRRMNASGLSVDEVSLPIHAGSTADGRLTTSYDANRHLSYGRVDVAGKSSMSWAPGDIPSTGWTDRQPYVKLWKGHTKEDKTYGQAPCYTPTLPGAETTYDNFRLRTMEEAEVVQRLCTDLSEGRTMQQNSTIYLNYVANSGDYLHRESADINDGHLRVVVTGLSSLEWTFLGKVTFSGGGLVTPVSLDYEFSREHVFDPVLADTFAIWEIPLGEDVLTAMKAMTTGNTMQIEITVAPTTTGRIPFLELACHAEDAAPRLEFWKSSTINAIVGNRPDKAAKDFTAASIVKTSDFKVESFAKLDQSSQHVGTASYTVSAATVFGRYGKAYGEYLPSNHSSKSWTIDGNPFSGTATRLVTTQMDGFDDMVSSTDIASNTVTATKKQYGLNTITFQDNTTQSGWDTIAAASALVASPSGFYGICFKSKSIDENGNHVATYIDGLGRTRYVVVDSGGLDLVTTYTYNTRNQLMTVTNPAGQDVTYGYDRWGNVTSVTHPDFSTVRAKYNNAGQVRFTQKKTQSPGDGHAGDAVTFYQYDDLGRVTAIGEAVFESSSAFAGLDSSTINLTGAGSTYKDATVNPSLFWGAVAYPTPPNIYPLLPPLAPTNVAGPENCLPQWDDARPPYEAFFPVNVFERTIIKPVVIGVYDETAPYGPVSATNDFEDFTDNPHNGRQAVSYDQMPGVGGSFWRSFPTLTQWNSLSKTGTVRNQAGRVAAIAYRDHPYEPYRYRVYSYDERGRVECVLKLTPALGFDAVYYSYNSSDQVTSIHVVDALRQYATWYGYDDNGRVAEMTSHVTPVDLTVPGNGLGFTGGGVTKPVLVTRPVGAPRVTYTYDAIGNLTGKVYHDADDLNRELNTSYSYDARWRLQQQDHSWDIDPVSSSDIYTRDNGGRITQRSSRLLDGDVYDHTYTYDNAGRLLTVDVDHNLVPWKSETYDVDDIARRTQTTKTGVVAGYTYAPLPTSATNAPTDVVPNVNGEILTDDQTYNRDGAMNYRYLRPQGIGPTVPYTREWFHYGYNDRLIKMQTDATGMKTERYPEGCVVGAPYSLSFSLANRMEWQYSYSPSGEREIKRLVLSPTSDSSCGTVFPWTYYLQGAGDEQQVVYHGRQISRGTTCDVGTGRRVFFYPVEYRSYGVDGVNIVWERNANGVMAPRFVGTDIQGSERYAVGKNAYQKVRDYLPFGVDVAVANDQRRGYLGKESDYETSPQFNVVLNANLYHERLMDMGARKYSKTQGAFTSVDALWAGQIGHSPYAYSFHDPINFMDPTGLAGEGGPPSPGTPPPMGVAGYTVPIEKDAVKVKQIETVIIEINFDPVHEKMVLDAMDKSREWQNDAKQFLSNQDALPRRDATSTSTPIRPDDPRFPRPTPVLTGPWRATIGPAPTITQQQEGMDPEGKAILGGIIEGGLFLYGGPEGMILKGGKWMYRMAKALPIVEKTVVYISRTEKGIVQYVGITNNLARRTADHLRTKGIDVRYLLTTTTREEARAVEQALIEINGLSKNGGSLLNKINSIAPWRPEYRAQVELGYELLKRAGYK